MNANAAADGLLGRVLRSPAARLLGLGVLALALQVAVLFIGELVRERQGTRDAAVAEIAAAWGGAQRLAGPFLLVPYRTPAERDGARQGEAAATFLPVELQVTVALTTERLRRGLFQAPVASSSSRSGISKLSSSLGPSPASLSPLKPCAHSTRSPLQLLGTSIR